MMSSARRRVFAGLLAAAIIAVVWEPHPPPELPQPLSASPIGLGQHLDHPRLYLNAEIIVSACYVEGWNYGWLEDCHPKWHSRDSVALIDEGTWVWRTHLPGWPFEPKELQNPETEQRFAELRQRGEQQWERLSLALSQRDHAGYRRARVVMLGRFEVPSQMRNASGHLGPQHIFVMTRLLGA